jgi:hypothetical protein
MNEKIWTPGKILDKRIKDGWFGRSYYLTIKFLTTSEDSRSTFSRIEPSVCELKGNAENYYEMEIGEAYNFAMYRHADGRLYHYSEY